MSTRSSPPAAAPLAHRSIRKHLLIGLAVVALLVGGVGGWAATTEFSGAVIAQGQLVVDSNVKKVQHPTGGVVGELRVRDGSRVKAGDVVIRLDETQTKANLAIIVNSLREYGARRARQEAQLADLDQVDFPADLLAARADPEVARLILGEQKLFDDSRKSRQGQKSQLKERISQLAEELRGLEAQIVAKDKQVEWIIKELAGVEDLWKKQLVQFNRVTALQRDHARLEGERGQLVAATAQSKGKVSEIELQILQIDQQMRTDVGKDLAEIRARMAELIEKRVAAEDQLMRVDIRAPQDGRVHQLDVHTVGGVVTPGQPIMLIVPESDRLIVEAKAAPHDVDQLRVGQTAVLRFGAFNQRTTPELNGELTHISPDVTIDPKSGLNYYTIRIAVSPAEIARLDGLKLIPGMPVDVFVQTEMRTVASFVMKPLYDQVTRAFRER